MRKIVCFMLTVCIFVLSGCSLAPAAGSTGKSKPIINELAEKGIELISKVDKLAECEEYTSIYKGDEQIASIIKGIADNDYATPQGIFVIEDLDSLVIKNMMSETKLPEDIAQMLKGRFASALPTQITAMNGATSLAAASILNYEESFIYKGLEKSMTYLYVYGNDYSFMVNYSSNNEDIVRANVSVVVNNELSKCASQKDVIAFFADTLNFQEVSVSVAAEAK